MKTPEKRDRILLVITSIYLVLTFLRRLAPVDEMPSSALATLSLIFDLAMAFGVIGLGAQVLKATPPGRGQRAKWVAVITVGIVAAVGVLAIRISGGQRVELPPHPRASGFSG